MTKWHEENLGHDGYMPCLDCSDSFTGHIQMLHVYMLSRSVLSDASRPHGL